MIFQHSMIYFLLTITSTQLSRKTSSWSVWSTCSRSCGGGLQSRSRITCKAHDFCDPPSYAWRACALNPCSSSTTSWRDEQCESLNKTLSRSVLLPSSPCSLECISEERALEEEPKRLSDVVLDGTLCGNGELRMCLAGKCQQVGCDLQLGSRAALDKCGLCGGRGDTCGRDRSESFVWEHEVDSSECSVSCGRGHRLFQYFCVNSLTKEKVHFGFCDQTRRPENMIGVCNNFPCPAR